jgi:hypothetical protein
LRRHAVELNLVNCPLFGKAGFLCDANCATIVHNWSAVATHPKNCGDLIKRVTDIWNSIPVSTFENLALSFQNRLSKVKKAKGETIFY